MGDLDPGVASQEQEGQKHLLFAQTHQTHRQGVQVYHRHLRRGYPQAPYAETRVPQDGQGRLFARDQGTQEDRQVQVQKRQLRQDRPEVQQGSQIPPFGQVKHLSWLNCYWHVSVRLLLARASFNKIVLVSEK